MDWAPWRTYFGGSNAPELLPRNPPCLGLGHVGPGLACEEIFWSGSCTIADRRNWQKTPFDSVFPAWSANQTVLDSTPGKATCSPGKAAAFWSFPPQQAWPEEWRSRCEVSISSAAPLMAQDIPVSDLLPGTITQWELVDVQGVPLPSSTADHWDQIWGFQARPDDVLICTYPKAGTTWIQEILDMIQQDRDTQKCSRAPIYQRIPFLELCRPPLYTYCFKEAEAMSSPRILKIHLPIQLVPPSFWEQDCKVIYVARNPKDTAVSYYYFQQMNHGLPDPGNWDQYLETFLAGKVPWGSWFDHVRAWWDARDKHRILYLFYEDIKKDPRGEIRKMGQFLGRELPESVLEEIVQHTSFENMRENPMANYSTVPSFIMDQAVSPFMRKGMVGDWTTHFTVAQSERFDDEWTRRLEGSNLHFRTRL
uniref:Sulfotransferase n=1 Tax=Pelusios castaneus TaxID=367368 RepID=A0A8C8S9J0_9SAUR